MLGTDCDEYMMTCHLCKLETAGGQECCLEARLKLQVTYQSKNCLCRLFDSDQTNGP